MSRVEASVAWKVPINEPTTSNRTPLRRSPTVRINSDLPRFFYSTANLSPYGFVSTTIVLLSYSTSHSLPQVYAQGDNIPAIRRNPERLSTVVITKLSVEPGQVRVSATRDRPPGWRPACLDECRRPGSMPGPLRRRRAETESA